MQEQVKSSNEEFGVMTLIVAFLMISVMYCSMFYYFNHQQETAVSRLGIKMRGKPSLDKNINDINIRRRVVQSGVGLKKQGSSDEEYVSCDEGSEVNEDIVCGGLLKKSVCFNDLICYEDENVQRGSMMKLVSDRSKRRKARDEVGGAKVKDKLIRKNIKLP